MDNIIDLSGKWSFIVDSGNTGISEKYFKSDRSDGFINLPGSACEAKIGEAAVFYDEMTKESVRSLRPAYEYKGAVWYSRQIEFPEEYEGKKIYLYMERVMISSDVWLDGEKIGRTQFSMCTPHIYELPYSKGVHTLSVRIDNSDMLSLENMASGYTDDTQTVWNGIVGRICLYTENIYSISNLQIYPDVDNEKIKIAVTVDSDLSSPSDRAEVKISLCVSGYDDDFSWGSLDYTALLYHSRQIIQLEYDMPDCKLWDEFSPALYSLKAVLEGGNCVSSRNTVFGMRKIETDGKKFMLNNRQIFLRGTLDCCVYPDTGYPPVSLEKWLDVFKTVKSYGLNHVRFHSWCPPENAFLAADITGIYVLAEMPFWLNKDVCRIESGDDSVHALFFGAESERISKFYGNHPSFCMFSNGNELLGDFEMLYNITKKIKALDNRRLYTLTSNFDRPATDADDYFCAFRSNEYGIRLQYFHKEIPKGTYLDYSDGINAQSMPVVSFEIGQYCVYPDVSEIHKYNRNTLPVNFDVIKKDLERKNLMPMLGEYIKASGKLAELLYKEEIETTLRTEDMGGFELLGIHDYPGQCTATVGLLNSFWESKGITEPEKFREFCCEAVPLIKTKRIYKAGEVLNAEFMFADFRKEKMSNPEYLFELYDNGKCVYTSKCDAIGDRISVPLDFVKKPVILEAVLSVKDTDYKNRMNIFVFDHTEKTTINNGYDGVNDEVMRLIEQGGKAVIFAKGKLKTSISGSFYPVFWSPAYFPSKKPCGIICDEKNGLFAEFPTGKYSDYQWYNLLENSESVDISAFGNELVPAVELVPNFFDNTRMAAAFECRVGKADIFVCGFDRSSDTPEEMQMMYAINKYVNSENFRPSYTADRKTFLELFK